MTARADIGDWAASAAPEPEFMPDFDACKVKIIELMRSARTCVYYSTFLCDLSEPLGDAEDSPSFLRLIEEAAERGVAVRILYNPLSDYGTASARDFVAQLPASVVVHAVEGDFRPSWLARRISSNASYSYHHQKYLCVDGERMMVTGCDINGERAGWLQLNVLGYCWHELSCVVRCTPEMFAWVQRNFERIDPSPPLPLCAGMQEHDVMVKMIEAAEASVQLENQIMVSGGAGQANGIMEAIVARIARADREGTDFHAVVLTNIAQNDEPSYVVRVYCAATISWTLQAAERHAARFGISTERLYQSLFVGRLETPDGVLVKVHSNIIITDGRYAIRTSSNLSDRSWSAEPCDTELGVLSGGASVGAFQQRLINAYLLTEGEAYTFADFWQRAMQSEGLLRRITETPYRPCTATAIINFMFRFSEGSTGGHVHVGWTTETWSAETLAEGGVAGAGAGKGYKQVESV